MCDGDEVFLMLKLQKGMNYFSGVSFSSTFLSVLISYMNLLLMRKLEVVL